MSELNWKTVKNFDSVADVDASKEHLQGYLSEDKFSHAKSKIQRNLP